MFKPLTFFLVLVLNVSCWTQIITVDSSWHLPIGISAPELSAGFGDMRPNHFHMGLDFRTKGQEGFPLYAIADGYISRIKIQSIGYGKAIYIDHPNGYTTVYGHLQKYSGKIAQWIHNYQYKNQTFEFDYVFEKPILLVKKGDTIGLSGNSGGSSGPHVHFEIRNTKSEKIINPTLFGIIPFDTFIPTIKKVFIYKFVKYKFSTFPTYY